MNIDENKAILKEIWEEMLNKGNFERLYDLIHKDYVYHGSGHEVKGPDSLKQFLSASRENVSNMHFVVEDLIAEGDKVVSRYTVLSTLKASGKKVSAENMIVSRIADGKVIEEWETIDRLGLAQQSAKGWLQKGLMAFIVRQVDKGLGFAN
jgi:predicted ester cyclase